MFSKRRFCDENSESYVDTFATESDSSDIIRSVRKKCKRLVIDDISDEDQLSEPWIWKEIRNSPKIWNYTMIPASKLRPSRPCKVCMKNKKRSETTWECKRCKVPLHVLELQINVIDLCYILVIDNKLFVVYLPQLLDQDRLVEPWNGPKAARSCLRFGPKLLERKS
ncbi:hypothetical protein K0M31_011080 [Melipona bicolor]|uniref:Uncharacterized protein n=1 Tax=Melipona bicolor TaxID=60889 RepID=A0AA40KHU0_9HYME|nr:hypothetical protein K0M31_011080 [Melipona bicolor]